MTSHVAPEANRRTNRLPSLTGLRWLAALLVFGLHIHLVGYFGGMPGHAVGRLFSAGRTGVSFFFILSGFILMWSSPPSDRASRFWRRRFARIYPVHFATALLALAMAFSIAPSMRPTPAKAAANLLLLHAWHQNWGAQALNPVSWSLACEAFFYALFPALAWVLRRCPARVCALLAVLSAVAVFALPTVNDRVGLFWNLYYEPLARLPEFVLGAAIARLVILDRWRGPGLGISMVVAAAGYLVAPQFGKDHAGATLVGFALLVAAGARADLTGSPSLWRHPVLVRLGELSFAFYMIHVLILRTGEELFTSHPQLPLLPALGATLAAFACSLTLAWILYRCVEGPARRLLLRPRRVAAAPARAG